MSTEYYVKILLDFFLKSLFIFIIVFFFFFLEKVEYDIHLEIFELECTTDKSRDLFVTAEERSASTMILKHFSNLINQMFM